MEEIQFKLYKRYQKEEEILRFRNSRTALQKKIEDNRSPCQKKIIIIIIIIIVPRG